MLSVESYLHVRELAGHTEVGVAPRAHGRPPHDVAFSAEDTLVKLAVE